MPKYADRNSPSTKGLPMSDEQEFADDARTADQVWHDENRAGREQLIAENAALRAQLAEQEQRLAAAEKLLACKINDADAYRIAVDLSFAHDVVIARGHIGLWSAWRERDGEAQHLDGHASPIDAYLAAVAQGWLPEPKKGATP